MRQTSTGVLVTAPAGPAYSHRAGAAGTSGMRTYEDVRRLWARELERSGELPALDARERGLLHHGSLDVLASVRLARVPRPFRRAQLRIFGGYAAFLGLLAALVLLASSPRGSIAALVAPAVGAALALGATLFVLARLLRLRSSRAARQVHLTHLYGRLVRARNEFDAALY